MVSIKNIAIIASALLSASLQPVAGAGALRTSDGAAEKPKQANSQRSLDETNGKNVETGNYYDLYYPGSSISSDSWDSSTSTDSSESSSGDSTTTASSTSSTSTTCFSGETTVFVKDKGQISMKDLEVGDHVLTGNRQNKYQPIYAFGHYQTTLKTDYVQVQFVSANEPKKWKKLPPLEVSQDHLVFLQGQKDPVPASTLVVGDELVFAKDDSGNFTGTARVTKISLVQRNGVYAPLTADGSIIVSGILSSCYISLQPPPTKNSIKKGAETFVTMNNSRNKDSIRLSFLSQHSFVHVALTPFRLLCLSGMASSLCTQLSDDGMTGYVYRGIQFAQWMDHQYQLVQILALVFYAFFAAVMVPTEYVCTTVSTVHVAIALVACLLAKTFFAVRIGRSQEVSNTKKND